MFPLVVEAGSLNNVSSYPNLLRLRFDVNAQESVPDNFWHSWHNKNGAKDWTQDVDWSL